MPIKQLSCQIPTRFSSMTSIGSARAAGAGNLPKEFSRAGTTDRSLFIIGSYTRRLGQPHGPFSPTGAAWIVGPGSSSPFGETNTIWITCGGPVGITTASSRSSRRDRFRLIIRAPHRLCLLRSGLTACLDPSLIPHSQDLSEVELAFREIRLFCNVRLPALLHRAAKPFPEYRGQVWETMRARRRPFLKLAKPSADRLHRDWFLSLRFDDRVYDLERAFRAGRSPGSSPAMA